MAESIKKRVRQKRPPPWSRTLLLSGAILLLVTQTGAAGDLATGQAALQAKRYDQAIKAYSQVLQSRDAGQAERLEALEGRCAASFKLGLMESRLDLARQAIADCSESIRLNPKNGRVWRLRGLARLVTGAPEKALINLNQALQLDGADATALRMRGLAHLASGKSADADADFNAALRLDPDQAWNHFNQGLMSGRQGQGQVARTQFQAFVRLQGAKALEFLALLQQEKSEPPAVLSAIGAVLQQAATAPVAAPPPADSKPEVVVTAPVVQPAPAASKPEVVVDVPPPAASKPEVVVAAPVVQPSPAPPPEPVAPAVAPSAHQEFLFKVGSYQDRGNAEGLMRKFTPLSLPMYIEEAEVGGRIFYRLWIGPFPDEATARAASEQIARIPGQKPEPIHAR